MSLPRSAFLRSLASGYQGPAMAAADWACSPAWLLSAALEAAAQGLGHRAVRCRRVNHRSAFAFHPPNCPHRFIFEFTHSVVMDWMLPGAPQQGSWMAGGEPRPVPAASMGLASRGSPCQATATTTVCSAAARLLFPAPNMPPPPQAWPPLASA